MNAAEISRISKMSGDCAKPPKCLGFVPNRDSVFTMAHEGSISGADADLLLLILQHYHHEFHFRQYQGTLLPDPSKRKIAASLSVVAGVLRGVTRFFESNPCHNG
jgi:hypothetical protein